MIDIKKLIRESGIEPGNRVADFGAGSGFIAIEIAKHLGEQGNLTAIDIQSEPLEVLETKAKHLKLFNLKTIKSDLEQKNGSTLENSSFDFVVIANLLLQIETPQTIVQEAKRILKLGGKIVLLEWLKEKMLYQTGNYLHGQDEIKKLLENNGLSLVKKFDPGVNHFGLIFQK